jgi:EAL domain-containing protein (putative c-di-GMP-specific phosphodiesterase class I)
MEKHFLDTVSFVIQHYGLEGKNLTFEIMENTLPENMELFITLLHDIKKMGITIALDDYGTGHTSLKYLIDLPLDYIKIDRSFVSNVHQNKKKLLLLKTIIDMASILDLNVIAEGVEKEEEDKILKDLSAICTIQGYLYSKPIEAKALLEL